jgi:membrane fusion protein, heavy metal efflux system
MSRKTHDHHRSNQSDAGKSGRRKYVFWMAGGLALVATAPLGFIYFGRSGDAPVLPEIHEPVGPVDLVRLDPNQRANVLVESVREDLVPFRISVPGRVEFNANRVTPVFAQFSGRIVRLDAEVGRSVREGEVLAILDSPDAVAMHAEYHEALAGERAARVSLDNVRQARERAERLIEFEAIPLRELREAEVAEARAVQDLLRAEAAAAAARGRLEIAGFGDEELERLETGPASIGRMVSLTAPVDGTIVDRNLGLGQMVEPGGEVLFKIADLSTVWVLADVYEDQLASVRPGAEVTIRTPAYPSEPFSARVDRIGPTVDPNKRTAAVRCVVSNGDGRLKPGMFASVKLQTAVERVLLVPASAIVASGDRRTVFVETEPDTYRERVVETGDRLSDSVVVRSGLREGERVVVLGGLLLFAQMREAGNRR